MRGAKSGLRSTEIADYWAVGLPKMPKLRSTGSEGMQVWRREFHDGMGPTRTFGGIPARTRTGGKGEPLMISSAPTTTTTTTTTVLIGSTYYLLVHFPLPLPAGRLHMQSWG